MRDYDAAVEAEEFIILSNEKGGNER